MTAAVNMGIFVSGTDIGIHFQRECGEVDDTIGSPRGPRQCIKWCSDTSVDVCPSSIPSSTPSSKPTVNITPKPSSKPTPRKKPTSSQQANNQSGN